MPDADFTHGLHDLPKSATAQAEAILYSPVSSCQGDGSEDHLYTGKKVGHPVCYVWHDALIIVCPYTRLTGIQYKSCSALNQHRPHVEMTCE